MNQFLYKPKRFLVLTLLGLLMILPYKLYAQTTFIGSTPSAASSISVCDEGTDLTVSFRVMQQHNGTITVSVKLAEGIEYAEGLTHTSPNSVLGVSESNVTNRNQPVFTVSSANGDDLIEIGEEITFSFKRKATCAAYQKALTAAATGFEFKDAVTLTIDAQTSIVGSSNAYNVTYPNLTISQPPAQNNKQVGDEITRDFTITNGSDNSAKTVYLSIDYGNAAYLSGTGAAKLQYRLGTAGTYTDLTPTSTVGTVVTYTLTGAILGADNQLTNGEVISLKETFKLKTCAPTTTYKTGWGCSVNEQCEIKTTSAIITMVAGIPRIENGTTIRSNFTSVCQPFTVTATFKNNGTGGKMGGMYDIKYTTNAGSVYSLHKFLAISVNGHNITNNNATGRSADISFDNLFATDPDGSNVGLDDLDGDGYFDDLPAGATLTLTLQVELTCSEWTSCGNERNISDPGLQSIFTYHNACDKENWISTFLSAISSQNPSPTTREFMFVRSSVRDMSYIPANIESGTSFDIRIMARENTSYSSYTSDNTRYVIEVDIPAGLAINPAQVKWYNTNSQMVTGHNSSIQNGKLIVVSPDNKKGYIDIENMVYDCGVGGQTLTLNYRIKEIFDYINYSTCVCPEGSYMCGSVIRTVIGCEQPVCPSGGPTTGLPVVEREDNSLGWTDKTMATTQSRANISSYDLSKALYMDEIRVSSRAIQGAAVANLGARLVLSTDESKQNGLTPLSADVVITRNNTQVGQATGITKFIITQSSDRLEQIIDWDFASAMPAGGLQAGDSIKVVTRYRVTSNNYKLIDTQVGKQWYIYNSTSPVGTDVWEGTHLYCRALIPEMYLVGTDDINGTNRYNLSGCNPTYIGYAHSHIARRFDAGALPFEKEYRPGMKLQYFYLKMPKTYTLNRVEIETANTTPTRTLIAPESTQDMGNYYLNKYKIPADWEHFPITVANAYGAFIYVNVTPTCASSHIASTYDKISAYLDYTDFYYYTAKLGSNVPSAFQISQGLSIENRNLTYSQKPSVTLINQSGEVEMVGKTGEWSLRVNNPSNSTAPYVWLALPTVSGLTIEEVTTSLGQPVSFTSYSGGKMYRLSDSGIAAGTALDYTIKFTYSGCSPITLQAMGGWNCSSYPTSPNEYICNTQTVDLKLKPLPAAMELTEISVPNAGAATTLCNTLNYQYRIQATDNANVFSPTFNIFPENGLVVTPNVVEVEYPSGSNDWQTLAVVNNSVDLLGHTALAAVGHLKGISEAGATNEQRQIGVKFAVKTECSFVSGKNFKVRTNGLNACNLPASGSGITVNTPPINIDGASIPYNTSATTQITTVTANNSDCKAAKTIQVLQKIVGTGTTSANAYLEVLIPAGFKYIIGSYSQDNNNSGASNPALAGSNAATDITSVTTTADGEQKLTIGIKAGLGNGSEFAYKFNIAEDPDNVPTCKEYTLVINNIEQLAGLMCGTIQCTSTQVITGVNKHTFTYEKSKLAITASSATAAYANGTETISVTYTLSNSSAIELKSGTNVTLFSDKDNNGIFSSGDAVVGTLATTSDVTSTTPLTQTMTISGVSPANACNLVLSILPQDGCYCTITPATVAIATLPGIAGDDKTACGNGASTALTIGTPTATGYTYTWSNTDPVVLGYLSSANTANPTFTYPQTVRNTVSFTYTLTVERANGCTATDEVTVTLNRCNNYWHGGTAGNVNDWNTPSNWTANIVPIPGDDVEFATSANNNNDPASHDLYVPVGTPKVIGNLINESDKSLVVPSKASVTIGGTVTGSGTSDKAHKIHVKAGDDNNANGTLILAGQPCNVPVYGTVEFYAKGYKGVETTWTDNISGSPTLGESFTSQYLWQHFGVPVAEIVADPTFHGSYLREYSEPKNTADRFYGKWIDLGNSSVLKAFKGYEITQDAAVTYWIKGQLQHCDKVLTLTRKAAAVSQATGNNIHYGLGQNIFGNSYTAAINIDKMVFPAEVEKTVYLYNTGRFHDWATTGTTISDASSIAAGNYLSVPVNATPAVWDGQIPSQQGFLLRFTDTETVYNRPDATVTLKYADGGVESNIRPQLSPSNSGATPTTGLSFLSVMLESRSTVDRLWLIEQAGTTERFDNGWDGRKFFGTPTAFIYTQTPDGNMQVSANSSIDGTVITHYANGDSQYVLRLKRHNMDNTPLYLLDLKTRSYTELSNEETVYSFTAHEPNVSTKRFMIVSVLPGETDFEGEQTVELLDGYLADNNTLVINNLTVAEGVATIHDVIGRTIAHYSAKVGVNRIPVELSAGVYMAHIKAGEKNLTIKFIVK